MKILRPVVLALVCHGLGFLSASADVARLVNLSSRAQVGTGDDLLISGFVIGPGGNKTVLIRAVGPTLSTQGVSGFLADPLLDLHNSTGAIIASNDNWAPGDAATMSTVGAFSLPAGSKDSAIVRSLAPGGYSAVVSGVGKTTGISLIEIYEIDATSGRLINLSTRARIGTGDNLLISGFVVSGSSGTRRLLVRAAGPALTAMQVTGALADPTLRVVNAVSGATVSSNDNWGTPATSTAPDASTLNAAFALTGAFPFASGSKDAAVIADFSPGPYSINVTGVGGSTGVALVEVYDLTVETGKPNVTISATRSTADESSGAAGEFTFSRTGDTSQPLTATYSFGGNATLGADYTAGTGSISFGAYVSAAKLSVVPRSDLLLEGNESVTLTLNDGGAAYSVGSPGSATVTIVDTSPTLYVTALRPTSAATNSTGSGTATILLSPDNTFASISLSFSNLTSSETVAYLRIGNPGEVGVELLRLPAGQVDSTNWNINAMGGLSTSDILQAIREGRVFIDIQTTNFPAGELRGSFILANGSQTFVAPAAAPGIDLSSVSDTDATRFLTQATFGPTKPDIDALKQKGYSAWITEQLAKPLSSHREATVADFAANNAGGQNAVNGVNTRPGQVHRQAAWWKIALTGDDQLRQRVAFALSQLLVISDVNGTVGSWQEGAANYYDILARDGLGNFRTLLENVTLSPMMGVYLSHLRNARSTSPTGAQPDENYAREVMQLFTIGLSQLQPDGTLKLDTKALPIATYDQTTVTAMAKVFTGWGFYNTTPTTANFRNSPSDYINPMTLYSGFHDVTAKTIINGQQLPAGRTGTQDLQDTLDALFNHPNTAPFVSRQLIQHLVTSNPSPAYVYRVAQIFANNGSGVRGDLSAVVRAILLDYEARSPSVAANVGFGKLKEPLLRVTSLLRGAGFSSATSRYAINNANGQIGESALSAPTVFNFYEPDFVQAGVLATAGLYAPEYQILTATTAMSTPNYLYNFIFNATYQGVALTFTDLLPLAPQPTGLVDRLNLLLSGNALPAATTTRIVTALNALPTATTATDRVRTAIYLITTTGEGAVQQ
ncbi:MAG: DUF1800 family protein [Opitutus sp.]